ncbi:juvenile hormone esterase-like [Zophobas morio]|uniref:juvenile hormone esterase-like n=1 Tax=Zophobas morio TaxID=2755281 RepID=UPI003083324B
MPQPEVTIQQGTLRGSTATDLRGNPFLKFQGIPYAQPPLGGLRFKAPVPPEKWTGVFDATKEGSICYQRDLIKNGILVGTENCLFLNVYTKKLPKDTKDLRPVMFWIHGGGFILGHGGEELYGPDYLITEDVVVVTINYRLGLFGFVSFEDPSLEVPGNAGFKDQVMALRWVQNNIDKFGGDPNNVTIFGESAGAASVHVLVLSPLAKGLFHKAIAQSGCGISQWIRAAKGSKRLAKAMGLEGADDKTIFDALAQKSTEEVLQIQDKTEEDLDFYTPRLTGLVLETHSKEPFMVDEPINIVASGNFNQVPFMTGCTSLEGAVVELFKKPNDPEAPNFQKLISHSFGYKEGSPETKTVADKVKKFYFGDEEYSHKLLRKKYDLFSDVYFLYDTYVRIIAQSTISKAPTYLYWMTVETKLNFFKMLLNLQMPGVCHCDDIGYLFKHFATPEIVAGSVEDVCLTRFVKLWTNFAKFGNPTPDKNDDLLKVVWKPVTDSDVNFLEIGKELEAKLNPVTEGLQLWKQVAAESPAGKK